MERLKVFEGVPHPYDKKKKLVLPAALRVIRLKPGRKYCRLGDVASSVGWTYNDLIKRLEDKRKVKTQVFYTRKKQTIALRALATKNVAAQLAAITPGATVVPPGDEKKDDGSTSSKSKSDKPKSDKPKSDKPKSDKSKSDKSKSDKPKSDKPKSDKPKSDKPKSDKPKSDKPESDKPKADKADKADKPKADKPNADKADKPVKEKKEKNGQT